MDIIIKDKYILKGNAINILKVFDYAEFIVYNYDNDGDLNINSIDYYDYEEMEKSLDDFDVCEEI